MYKVKVVGNTEYCGIGAGGAQFANGEATITSDRLATWFREHEGYEVIEATEEEKTRGKRKAAASEAETDAAEDEAAKK